MRRLEEYPILLKFLEKLLVKLLPELGDVTPILQGYSLGDWSMGFSRADAIDREISGSVTIALIPPPVKEPFMDSGYLFNTNHGMFVFARDAARRLCEVEMHFYTRQAPPFFDELIACHPRRKSKIVQSMVQDARMSGVTSISEFIRSLVMNPINVVEMDDRGFSE